MRALIAVTILCIVYFVLKPGSPPKAAHPGRSIASVPSPLSDENVVSQKVELSELPRLAPPKGSEVDLKAHLQTELENARKDLSPRTIHWSQQLPKPKNLHEDAFNFYLQIAYENDLESKFLILERASDFLRLDDSFSRFISENLKVIETGRDQNVRNFIYEFAKTARPNDSFDLDLASDIRAFQDNPQSFSESDLNSLKKLILSAPSLSRAQKQNFIVNDF